MMKQNNRERKRVGLGEGSRNHLGVRQEDMQHSTIPLACWGSEASVELVQYTL